jgi:hypothetical protein
MAYIGLVPRRGRMPPPRPWPQSPPQPPGRPRAPAEDRNVLLIHGTTLPRAQAITSRQAMAPQRSFFALGMGNRDLARLFALRASQRSPREGPPALVLVTVPEAAFERLRKQRLLHALPFDPEDRPELRNRRQWVLEPGGVEILNREADSWRMVALRPP